LFAEHFTLDGTSDPIQLEEVFGEYHLSILRNVAGVPHSPTMSAYDLRPAGYLVLLNGFPGVGKLTIARSLQSSLTNQNVGTRLVDDHLIIDPAETVHPDREHQHRAFRDKHRNLTSDELKTLPETKFGLDHDMLIWSECC
jgi:hypothetical protein